MGGRRILLAVLALALFFTPGCGFLFVTIVGAVQGTGGPLHESGHVQGRTTGSFSRRSISCGAASSSPQVEHAFVAPRGGTYTFDSTTSDYDGVIAVFDASGVELACNDDHGSTRASEVVVTLAEGQAVTVVQGGYAGGAGSFELWVTGSGGGTLTLADGTVVPAPPAAPPQPLPVSASVQGDTTGLGAIAGVSCPPMSPMQEWAFTAPADGAYVFQVDSNYDAYLGVLDDAGTALACNDDFGSTTHARVTVELAQGQTARVVVGGYSSQSGAYSLTAVGASTGGRLTAGQPVLFAASATSSEPDVCGAYAGSVDRTFTFSPRAEAFYAFSLDTSAILVVSDGRHETACLPLDGTRRAGLVLKAGRTYRFVLELGASDGQSHTFSIDRVDPDAADWQVPVDAPPITAFTTPTATTTTPPSTP